MDKTFARRMRELREEQDLSQAALAARLELRGLKLDATAITRMERGTRKIQLGEAVAIAAALDVTVETMLRPVQPPEEQLKQAQEHAERAEWLHVLADSEHAAARARLARLQELHGEGGDDGGQHPEAP